MADRLGREPVALRLESIDDALIRGRPVTVIGRKRVFYSEGQSRRFPADSIDANGCTSEG
jgi:hypothetical protein